MNKNHRHVSQVCERLDFLIASTTVPKNIVLLKKDRRRYNCLNSLYAKIGNKKIQTEMKFPEVKNA